MKHENLQGPLADVGLGNAMSVMAARRMLGDGCRRKSSPNPPAEDADQRGPTARRSPSPRRRPIPACTPSPHISPGKGTGDRPGSPAATSRATAANWYKAPAGAAEVDKEQERNSAPASASRSSTTRRLAELATRSPPPPAPTSTPSAPRRKMAGSTCDPAHHHQSGILTSPTSCARFGSCPTCSG